MSISSDTYCLQCYLKRNLDLVRPLGSEEKAHDFAKKLMRIYLDAPEGVASPWFGPAVTDLLEEMYGIDPDRFHQEKIDSNRFVLDRLDMIRDKVMSAPDPLFAGMQFAILGNYLDFSALQGNVSFEKLEQMLDKALDMPLDKEIFDRFRKDLAAGKELLYLTDNAGEIGFDRVFAEVIRDSFPQLNITFCVRGGITLNDATRKDAETMGIPFPVIDNGNRVAGTQLDLLSQEARQALDRADVIIAKGLANTETMYGCGYNVYYAFLIKCDKFVRFFDKPMFTPMLVPEKK